MCVLLRGPGLLALASPPPTPKPPCVLQQRPLRWWLPNCVLPLCPLYTALAPSPPLDSGSGVNGSLIRGNSPAHRGSIMHTLSNDTWCTEGEGGGEDAVPPSCLHRGWNAFRAGVRKHIVEKKWFDNGVLLFILANCVTLAMDNPLDPPGTPKADFLAATELVGGVDVVFAHAVTVRGGLCFGACQAPPSPSSSPSP
jgi:hypothetical protein